MVVITISGEPAVGKSTLIEELVKAYKEYDLQVFSAGASFRAKGPVSTSFGSSTSDENKNIDARMLDATKKGNVLLDGRYAAIVCLRNNVPAFKIYLCADREERVKRFTKRGIEKEGSENPAEYLQGRLDEEIKKCKEIYDLDFTDKKFYDLYLDTTKLNEQQVFEQVKAAFKEWRDSQPATTTA